MSKKDIERQKELEDRLTLVIASKEFAYWLRILMTADIQEGQHVNPDFARDMARSLLRADAEAVA